MDKPLNSTAVSAALSMIEMGEWGVKGVKANVVIYLGELLSDGDPRRLTELRTRDVSRSTGISRSSVAACLAELVAEGVLEIDRGAGRRPHAYRLTADPRKWVGVPFRVDLERAATRVEKANRELCYVDERQGVASRTKKEPRTQRDLASGPATETRTQRNRCGRSDEANLDATKTWWPESPREPGHNENPVSESPSCLRTQDLADDGAPTSSLLTTSLSLEPDEPVKVVRDDKPEREDRLYQLKKAVVEHTGAAGVWGSPLKELRASVAGGLDVQAAIAGIARVPTTWSVDRICSNIRELAAGDFTIALPRDPDAGEAAPGLYSSWDERTEAIRAADREAAAAAAPPPRELLSVLSGGRGCQNGNGAQTQRSEKET